MTMGKLIDLTGKRFGRLTVIERDYEYQKSKKINCACWKCICDCGNQKTVRSRSLMNGKTQSCGCIKNERALESITELTKRRDIFLVENTDLIQLSKARIQKNNTSGTKGVYWNKRDKCWIATMRFKGVDVLDKHFKNKQDAINARKEAEEKYFKPILEKYDYEKFS
ncbi:AP2 domain-containing protein [Companilactobacillus versmoldensis]|nr:AP2 domain-containing protein [Companilactobacillus versmoldensis]